LRGTDFRLLEKRICFDSKKSFVVDKEIDSLWEKSSFFDRRSVFFSDLMKDIFLEENKKKRFSFLQKNKKIILF
jgi:hypothetical protein